LMTAIPLALSLLFPELLPGVITKSDKASLLLMGIAAGLVAGIFEELGWTGFAIPRLRLRYSVFTTGLIVGLLWGAWHFLVNFWSSGSPSGALSLALLLHSVLFSVGILPAYRVLMVWVYDRTGSLLVAMLMHLSLTASNVIFVPLATGVPLVTWSLVLAAALWVVVAAVAVANRGQISRQPLPREAA
jgi:membrane protease YdiL (CAAX protease family)